MMRFKLCNAVCLMSWSYCAPANAQSFDVVSVKETTWADSYTSYSARPRVSGQNVSWSAQTLRTLLAYAWGVDPRLVIGDTAVLEHPLFNLRAVAPAHPDEAALRAMFRTLLQERFGARVRASQREEQGFVLSPSQVGSAKLHPARDEPLVVIGKTVPPGSIGNYSTPESPHRIVGKGVSMKQLAAYLARELMVPVTDETGIRGSSTFKLSGRTWTRLPVPGSTRPI